jgi:hypothetical protein
MIEAHCAFCTWCISPWPLIKWHCIKFGSKFTFNEEENEAMLNKSKGVCLPSGANPTHGDGNATTLVCELERSPGRRAPHLDPGFAQGSPLARSQLRMQPADQEFDLLLGQYEKDQIEFSKLRHHLSEGSYRPDAAQIEEFVEICLNKQAPDNAASLLDIPQCAELLGNKTATVARKVFDACFAAKDWNTAASLLKRTHFGDATPAIAIRFIDACIGPQALIPLKSQRTNAAHSEYLLRMKAAFLVIESGAPGDRMFGALSVLFQNGASKGMHKSFSPEWRASHGVTDEEWLDLIAAAAPASPTQR